MSALQLHEPELPASSRVLRAAAIAVLLGLLFESWWGFRLLDTRALDVWTGDLLASVSAWQEPPDSSGVVVAAIDEASLQRVGRWPWPWETHARLVDELTRLGARVIMFDVLFLPPGHGVPETGLRALESSIRRSGRVLLGADLYSSSQGQGRVLWPASELRQAAKGCGLIVLPSDRDGVVRRTAVFFPPSAAVSETASNGCLQSIDLLTAAAGLGIPAPAASEDGCVVLADRLAARRTRLLADGRTVPIRFGGPPGSIPSISCADVLEGKVAEEQVRQRTVLVGFTAEILQDSYRVPTSGLSGRRMPGVEIHAHAVRTLQSGRGLQPAGAALQAAARYGLASVTAVSVVLLGPAAGLLVSFAIIGALFLGGVAAHPAGVTFDPARPLVLCGLVYVTCLADIYYRTSRRARSIRIMFSHYLNASVVEMLVQNPEKLSLGGEKRELTILFSDIRSFTTLSEGLSPEALVELLNEYLTRMTDIVFRHEGTLDKYIGDALMAFFGAPIRQAEHARRACHVALEMLEALEALNGELASRSKQTLAIGIGLNTGEAVVGNMGSRARFDYTVMGDSVNLASRLEGLTKQYGVHVIIGPATRAALGDELIARALDLVRVKGKKLPVEIFELVGRPGKVAPGKLQACRLFEAGLSLYREGRFEAAAERFRAALDCDPSDGPSKLFAARCESFLAHPPPAGWDGVYVATSK